MRGVLANLALLAVLATSAASDTIAADQGGGSAATYSRPTTHSTYAQLTAGNYEETMYAGSGGGESTMWIMMTTVSLGYMFLFFVLSASWCVPAASRTHATLSSSRSPSAAPD